MSIFRRLRYGLRSLRNREATDKEIDDELQQFLDDARADLADGNATPQEAARAVRLKYGSPLAARDEIRSFGWENALTSVHSDIRYGLRLLRKNPGFTAIVVLTLGFGIGSATAIFSAVSPVLFEPLPYPNSNRIVSITDRSPNGAPVPVTFGTYAEILERANSFQAMAAFKPWQPTLTGQGEPERLEAQRVSADYFAVLGIAPTFGPGFNANDDRIGGPNVVVLSDGLWRARFGTDSSIIGRDIALDGESFTVVGIMPRGFENVPSYRARAWSLLQYDTAPPSFETREWGHHLNMVGRLESGVEMDAAHQELNTIAANPIPERARPPWASMEWGITLTSLKEHATAGNRPVLLALLGAAALLLAIACVNVTNLLLARGARRRGELAMRTILGAAGGRLARQLTTEGLVLAVAGGALGLIVAQIGIGAIVALSPPQLPRLNAIALDGTAFAFAVGMTALVGIIVGLAPAVGVTRRNTFRGAMEVSARATGNHLTTRRALVVVEFALALMLLVGAGLLLRSLMRLATVAIGFDPSNIVVLQVQTSGPQLRDDGDIRRFFQQSLDAVRDLPGITSAAWTSQLPLSGDRDIYGVNFEQDIQPNTGEGAYRYAVTPGFFATMGIPVVRGRALDVQDVADAAPVVVVSESLARSAFPEGDVIGQRVHVGRLDQPWYTVVGVVGDVKQVSLDAGQSEAAYVTTEQWYFADGALWLVVQSNGDVATTIASIKTSIWAVDGNQPILRVSAMEDIVTQSEAQRHFALIVLEVFAALALPLAGIGLYGVVSGSVNERLHEIGIRSALGATRRSIHALVLRQGVLLTGLGVILGLAGAAAASEAVTTLLFGVSRLDPYTYAAVVTVLVVTSMLACWIPAVRAARVDPARALRAE